MRDQLAVKRLSILLLTFAAMPAEADNVAIYIDGAIGVNNQHDVSGIDGRQTLGRITVGAECDGLFVELEHTSDVQAADEGDNVVWLGLRRRWEW